VKQSRSKTISKERQNRYSRAWFSPDGKLVEKTFETGKEEAVLSQETICTMIEELNAGNPKERHIDLCGRATLTGGRKSYETSKTGIHVIIL